MTETPEQLPAEPDFSAFPAAPEIPGKDSIPDPEITPDLLEQPSEPEAPE